MKYIILLLFSIGLNAQTFDFSCTNTNKGTLDININNPFNVSKESISTFKSSTTSSFVHSINYAYHRIFVYPSDSQITDNVGRSFNGLNVPSYSDLTPGEYIVEIIPIGYDIRTRMFQSNPADHNISFIASATIDINEGYNSVSLDAEIFQALITLDLNQLIEEVPTAADFLQNSCGRRPVLSSTYSYYYENREELVFAESAHHTADWWGDFNSGRQNNVLYWYVNPLLNTRSLSLRLILNAEIDNLCNVNSIEEVVIPIPEAVYNAREHHNYIIDIGDTTGISINLDTMFTITGS